VIIVGLILLNVVSTTLQLRDIKKAEEIRGGLSNEQWLLRRREQYPAPEARGEAFRTINRLGKEAELERAKRDDREVTRRKRRLLRRQAAYRRFLDLIGILI
jgi:hypothetical protein